jgi:hypothetical protein
MDALSLRFHPTDEVVPGDFDTVLPRLLPMTPNQARLCQIEVTTECSVIVIDLKLDSAILYVHPNAKVLYSDFHGFLHSLKISLVIILRRLKRECRNSQTISFVKCQGDTLLAERPAQSFDCVIAGVATALDVANGRRRNPGSLRQPPLVPTRKHAPRSNQAARGGCII